MSTVWVEEVGNERRFIGSTVHELWLNGDVGDSGGGGRKRGLLGLRSMSHDSMAISVVREEMGPNVI
ncbi:hypothetical protein V6N13_072074 [Hibiscus sabdariffa]|uniref:Uncharacterized protein n=1 Tax=Hibiscus sabdariffa TaxID=183260 RepID=A0ABR2TBK1_9ROSI